jgi:hypothetical protein
MPLFACRHWDTLHSNSISKQRYLHTVVCTYIRSHPLCINHQSFWEGRVLTCLRVFRDALSFSSSVTRLGEFSTTGWLLTLSSCLEITKVATFLGDSFPHLMPCNNYYKKWIGLYFGQIYHNLIWSPCSPVSLQLALIRMQTPSKSWFRLDKQNREEVLKREKDVCNVPMSKLNMPSPGGVVY